MPPIRHSRIFVSNAAYVALGGALGSTTRWALSVVLGSAAGLVAVNMVGSVLIGSLYGWLDAHPKSAGWIKPFVGTGVLGGFTTYSSAILLTRFFADTQQWISLLLVFVGLPLACVLGVWFGYWITHVPHPLTEAPS